MRGFYVFAEQWRVLSDDAQNVLELVLKQAGFQIVTKKNSEDHQEYDQMITIKEACSITKLSRDTILRRYKEGCFKGKKIHASRSGSIRIERKSFYAWLENK